MKYTIIILILSLFLLFISGCIKDNGHYDESQTPDNICIGIIYFGGFHPSHTIQTHSTLSVNSNVYESLVSLDKDFKITPCLAESWSNPNSKTWRFFIRDNVSFHDGTRLHIQDVRYSLEREFDGEYTIHIINNNTIDILTNEPNPVLLYELINVFIIPQIFEDSTQTEPIGTGPYRYIDYVENDHVLLTRFDEYWGGRVDIKNVTFKIIPAMENRSISLLRNDIDISDLSAESLNNESAIKGINLHKINSPVVTYLSFDFRENNSVGYPNMTNPTSDVRVRKAMYHAINISELTKDNAYYDMMPATQYVSPYTLGYNPMIKRLPYDIDESKKLLDEAGYTNGFNITFDVIDYSIDMANFIQIQLEKINISVQIKSMPEKDFWHKLETKNTSFYGMGWLCSSDGGEIFNYILRTVDIANGIGSFNCGYYSNKKIDEIGENLSGIIDPTERKTLIQQGLQIAVDDIACIPLYAPQYFYGSRAHIEFTPRTDLMYLVKEIKIKEV